MNRKDVGMEFLKFLYPVCLPAIFHGYTAGVCLRWFAKRTRKITKKKTPTMAMKTEKGSGNKGRKIFRP